MSPDPAGLTGAPPGSREESPSDPPPAELSPVEAPHPAPPPVLRAPAEVPDDPIVAVPSRSERRRAAEAAIAAAPTDSVEEPTVSALPAPTSRRERKVAARVRARKVKRVIRRVDAWSVLKIAFVFCLCVYVVGMVAVVVLWNVAAGAGVIENIESFIEDLGAFETFHFESDQLLEATALGGAVLAILATGLFGLGAVLFNLICDLLGGIRVTVIEEPPLTTVPGRRSAGSPRGSSDTVRSSQSGTHSGL